MRQRIKENKKDSKSVIFLDKFIYIVGALGPIMTLPQAMQVWTTHEVQGLSLISWLSYTILSFFWILYGFVHKEKSIIFAHILWVIADVSVVLGILMFR